jgi:serine racemase
MEEEGQITKGKYAANISSIKEAHARIKSLVLKTPVLSSASLDAMSRRQLHFKCENFQKG